MKNQILIAQWDEKKGQNTITDDKLIRINDNKPEYGSMMVTHKTREFGMGGFTNPKTRVAFIAGTVEDLKVMIKENKLVAGSNFSDAFGDHKIIAVEKLESEVGPKDGFSEKINPTTGEILTKDDEKIMRRTYLVPTANENLVDVLIEHDREEVEVEADAAKAEFTAAK